MRDTVIIKSIKALCADGVTRTVTLHARVHNLHDRAETKYGYVKVGLFSVTGQVYLPCIPQLFERGDDGVNANLLPSWKEIDKALAEARPPSPPPYRLSDEEIVQLLK